jgi:hypothetical protein
MYMVELFMFDMSAQCLFGGVSTQSWVLLPVCITLGDQRDVLSHCLLLLHPWTRKEKKKKKKKGVVGVCQWSYTQHPVAMDLLAASRQNGTWTTVEVGDVTVARGLSTKQLCPLPPSCGSLGDQPSQANGVGSRQLVWEAGQATTHP